jgi:predicted nucleic acid-binding protein
VRVVGLNVQWELNAGASEMEVLALELETAVALDDLKARRYARQLSLTLTGTLGLLLEIHSRRWATRPPQDDLDLLEGEECTLLRPYELGCWRHSSRG